ncbi:MULTISPECIES: lanthionine synthetase C family protein [unclassified Streptomyces]|uniref:lanthionine synthetase C family protein n=1 Tax=unclassified Streptomyces TaxID=2593676 RepID=UPI0006ADF880|nr:MULTISPECIES: lanthionine synthetase C family protein [unclassified Streptomyces]
MGDLTHDLGRGLPGSVIHEGLLAQRTGRWESAHRAARAMAGEPAAAHPDSAGLFYGAPAVAFALHTVGHPAYRSALASLEQPLVEMVSARLAAAHERLDSRRPARMREYDLISGLSGLGAYLLHRGSSPELLCGVLRYLVRLLREPVSVRGHEVPGWWTSDGPSGRPGNAFPSGHANWGVAHGVAGPITLLALAARAGLSVPGQQEALTDACRLLERWALPAPEGGAAWPETLGLDAWLDGPVPQYRAGRPSWCYGTPGIARALQLASVACDMKDSRVRAEDLLAACLGDPRQLDRVTDLTVCHGWAGLCLAAEQAAADASVTSPLRRMLPSLRDEFTARLERGELPEGAGLLTGADGVLLTVHTLNTSHPVASGWATCLLLI